MSFGPREIHRQDERFARAQEDNVKITGPYYEQHKVTFPHKAVKSHGEHVVHLEPGEPTPSDRVFVVNCDGTVIGAQG